MVSTRHHPRDFGTPTDPKARIKATSSPSPSRNGGGGPGRKWVHTPSAAVTLWLVLSIPFVLWDAGYVLLRPHSMPGHKLHSPIWTPYALYGTIDYIYGWPAFNENNGFTAAQTIMNLFETVAYVYYLAIVCVYGVSASGGRKKSQKGLMWFLMEDKAVAGRNGAVALLVAYTASVMTVSKTTLYWLNEFCSGFSNIGHNDSMTLIFLWIIPNGLWLVFPGYNIYLLGSEIMSSLQAAAPRGRGRPRSS